jgi:hypothetical protein
MVLQQSPNRPIFAAKLINIINMNLYGFYMYICMMICNCLIRTAKDPRT